MLVPESSVPNLLLVLLRFSYGFVQFLTAEEALVCLNDNNRP